MALVAVLAAALATSACGYRVAGRGSNLPQNLKVIAVPAFENRTTSMGLEQRLTDAVMREFIHRTRYRVVGVEEGADAVLHGTVLAATTVPVLFDPATGRASAVLATVTLSVEMRDLHTQQVLYANSNYVFRDQYEITGDVNSFFEEREPALERLARDFGAALVSAVLENF